jgi:hypothetical protein
MCGESAFGGSCEANFTCDGDAIFCAIALEQHRRDCTLFEDETPLSELGNQVVSGEDPLEESLPKPDDPEVVELPQLDDTEIFAASCIADIETSVLGQPIHIDTDQFCEVAAMLGNIMVMGCAIIAAFIIGRI